MSEKAFVFRIGPIPEIGDGSSLYFVFPAPPDSYSFAAPDDRAGWQAIAKVHDLAQLACEPALDNANKPEGVIPEAYDTERSQALAMMTYMHLAGEPIQGLTLLGTLTGLIDVTRDYLNSDYAAGLAVKKPLLATFSAKPNIQTAAWLGDGDDRRKRVVFEFTDLKFDGDDATIRFGVDFMEVPEYAVDAMRRGFGLDTLPMPWIGSETKKRQVNDFAMILLISALCALAAMKTAAEGGTGYYDIADMNIICEII